jgi:hypothetical protein
MIFFRIYKLLLQGFCMQALQVRLVLVKERVYPDIFFCLQNNISLVEVFLICIY